jgi:hypothetical protein
MQSDLKVIKTGSIIQSEYVRCSAESTPCLSIYDRPMPQEKGLLRAYFKPG